MYMAMRDFHCRNLDNIINDLSFLIRTTEPGKFVDDVAELQKAANMARDLQDIITRTCSF